MISTPKSAGNDLHQRLALATLVLVLGWYAVGTLPYLDTLPIWNWDEGQYASAAYRLAAIGVYGSELYAGYYHSTERLYNLLPLFPLASAEAIRLFGLRIESVRLVSVLAGAGVVGLTFALGREAYGELTGAVAAILLCVVRLNPSPGASGIPLLDLARVARPDMLVAFWALAACVCFVSAHRRSSNAGFTLAGICVGLATLSHAYAPMILAPLLGAWVWADGLRIWRTRRPYMILGACAFTLLPWLLYVAQDPTDFQGQLRLQTSFGRFDLANPAFFLNNLLRERMRYAAWLGGSLRAPILWPRAGIWFIGLGAPVACAGLWRKARASCTLTDTLMFLSLVVLFVSLALIESMKLYGYLAIILPFLALQLAWLLMAVARWLNVRRKARLRLAIVLSAPLALFGTALVVEGGLGIRDAGNEAASTTRYAQLTGAIAYVLQPGARVLLSNQFWLGLPGQESRSVYLPYLLSAPLFNPEHPLSMEAALRVIAPDYVLADPIVSIKHSTPPGPDAAQQVEGFNRFLSRYCAAAVLSLPDRDYGPLVLYRCDMGAP